MRRPPVVALLHGWPVTAAHWRFLSPALRAAGFEVIELSPPGLGAATPDSQALDKESLARWVLTELDAAGAGCFALVGHDWGGSIAALGAGLAPERTWALVVEEEILPGVDVALTEPGASTYPQWHGAFNREPGLAEGLLAGRENAYLRAFLDRSAGPLGLAGEAIKGYLAAYAAEGSFASSLALYRTRAADQAAVDGLRRTPFPGPAMALGGAYGMGAAVSRGLTGLAHDVMPLVLADSGHYPAEQEPELTIGALVPFLRKHAPSA